MWGLAGCLWLKASHEVGVRLSGAAVSSKGSTEGALASKLTYVVVSRIYFLKAVGLRASVQCWLFVRGPHSVPSNMNLSKEEPTTWQLASLKTSE